MSSIFDFMLKLGRSLGIQCNNFDDVIKMRLGVDKDGIMRSGDMIYKYIGHVQESFADDVNHIYPILSVLDENGNFKISKEKPSMVVMELDPSSFPSVDVKLVEDMGVYIGVLSKFINENIKSNNNDDNDNEECENSDDNDNFWESFFNKLSEESKNKDNESIDDENNEGISVEDEYNLKEDDEDEEEEYEIDLLDILLDDENKENITLMDEDGHKLVFEQVAVIPNSFKNDEKLLHVVLKPLDEIDGIGDEEALVFYVDMDENGKSVLKFEEDEDVAEKVFEEYYKLLEDANNQANEYEDEFDEE